MVNKLIEESKEILMSYNIKELEDKGLRRERGAFEQSHTIVTYPPLQACSTITQEDIFTNNKRIKKDIALYIHLPFCITKCLYCHYITILNQSFSIVQYYLNHLKKEIELLLRIPEMQDMNIKSIHVGGGTPTYLSDKQLEDLMDFLHERLNIDKNAEVTFESCPETLIVNGGNKKLRTLLEKGVNRLSIGIQSFDDNVLKTAGRSHNSKEAIMAFKLAKNSGFKNINIDLMIGLPNQTLESWNKTLTNLEKLEPESITAYHLRIKPIVPLFNLFQSQLERFPSDEEILLMDIMTRKKLLNLGYTENPANWFNRKPEFIYHHQEQKWKETVELLGVGVSSYSFINNVQYYNYDSLKDYFKRIDSNRLPIYRGFKLNNKEQTARKIIFGLKMSEGIDKSMYYNLFRDKFDRFSGMGLLEINKSIRLTQKGFIFVDEVCKEFYTDEVKKKL